MAPTSTVGELVTLPVGPQRLDARDSTALEAATCGLHTVTADDFVLADDDGALFIPLENAAEVAEVAATIRDTERSQRRGCTWEPPSAVRLA